MNVYLTFDNMIFPLMVDVPQKRIKFATTEIVHALCSPDDKKELDEWLARSEFTAEHQIQDFLGNLVEANVSRTLNYELRRLAYVLIKIFYSDPQEMEFRNKWLSFMQPSTFADALALQNAPDVLSLIQLFALNSF